MPTGETTSFPHDEQRLLQALRSSHTRERAFEEVIRLYQKPLYFHLRKMTGNHADTDDILQNAFIKAWKYIDQFRGEAKLKTWLFRIATNECLTFLNRQKKKQATDLSDIEDHISHSHTEVNTLTGEDIQAKLQAAVAALPNKQRLVFNMKYFEELKYTEIQSVLGGSTGSLKASFHHAVKKIEHFLKTG